MKTYLLILKAALLAGVLAFNTACSTQWIEADLGLSGDEVYSEAEKALDDVEKFSASSSSSKFRRLLESPTSAIYFADAPSPVGLPASVAGLLSFGFAGHPEVYDLNLTSAVVIYVQDYTDQGLESALLIKVESTVSDEPIGVILENTREPYVEDGEYVAVMGLGSEETLVLRTYNTTDDGDLAGVIKFNVFDFDSAGYDQFLGVFSPLVGYGG